MDYNKIGNFIAEERKAKKLTQAKLAEKLFVSEKTISKWENGNGLPDTNTLPKLCEIFGISMNELLSGERIPNEEYVNRAEEKILQLQKEKESKDRTLLIMEIVIGLLSTLVILTFVLVPPFLPLPEWAMVLIMVVGIIIGFVGLGFALKIEQVAGYYKCKHCEHKYVPTYRQVNLAMHFGRTRYMKCPKCNKYSWNKKVIK